MIISLDHSPVALETHYCRISPNYILHESAYSILCRFALYNVVVGRDLVSIFANHETPVHRSSPRRSPHLACMQSVDLTVMTDAFNLPMPTIERLFLCPTWVPFDRHVAEVLKVCPECLAQGRHYTIFQYGLVHQCPVHQLDLQQRCPNCSASVRYAMSAQLFKTPYGCWHCGRQLGAARSKNAVRYINATGMARLRKSYRAFELTKGQHLNFAIGGSEGLYFDNVLQFSTSLRAFSDAENALFRHIQGLAADVSPKLICAQYAWFRWQPKSSTRLSERYLPVTEQELRSTAKAIFRHFRKKHLGAFKLARRMLLPLWRSLELCKVPEGAYPAIAWLDWYSFWSGARAPSQLLNKNGIKNISIWLEEISRHSIFLNCPDTCVRNWLTQRLFAHDVFTLLLRQVTEVLPPAAKGLEAAPATIEYKRKVLPVGWAVYFQSHLSHMRIVFIPCAAGVTSLRSDYQKGTKLTKILESCVEQGGWKYY